MSNLNPLPPSTDKEFWEHADIHSNIVPELVYRDSPHTFIRITGRQAKCTHCEWGFDLDPGDAIKDGHLYDKTGRLVI